MTRKDEIESRIALLPSGYITHRTVNGKTYHYRQGTKEGRQFSIRIPDSEVEDLKRRIEERKALERELRELRGEGNDASFLSSFMTNVMTGDLLIPFAESAARYQKRDCYKILESYVHGGTEDRVCILYGLRRTGKTTLIKQLLNSLEGEMFLRSAYIKCRTADTVASLNRDLGLLRSAGYRYIFIDEVTLISDFIDSASLFSDVYSAGGMKIVLSGTDSLSFRFALKEELYDRAVTIHTTYIPFREHSRLLGIDDIDEYIRYGGTLRAGEIDFDNAEVMAEEASFRDDKSTRHYIDTAIARNIQRSLEYYRDGRYFRALRSLYEKDELTSAIERIIEDMNHSFTLSSVTSPFVSHDLSSASQLLRSERNENKRTDILDRIDTTPIVEKMKSLLSIKEKEEQRERITEVHLEEIKEYLKALDLIEYVTVENRYPGNPALNSSEQYVIFTQPGMRFSQAEALVRAVLSDPVINVLSPETMENMKNKIIEDVMGRMLEDIVMLDTMKKNDGKVRKRRVFKIRFSDGEYDMVIADSNPASCELYEIKHSKERHPGQYRHLVDRTMTDAVEAVYGKITARIVLYRGEDHLLDNGIEYRNVGEYLKKRV